MYVWIDMQNIQCEGTEDQSIENQLKNIESISSKTFHNCW